jgi:hypothetical protein
VICRIENGIFDLLPGMDFGMEIDENTSYIEQKAEVCVLPGCTVAHPHLDTTVSLEGLATQIIEESDVPQWIWDLDIFNIIGGVVDGINALVHNLMRLLMLDNMAGDIHEVVFDEEAGKGMLIELISFDIKYDGVRPPHEVMNCTGASCSSASPAPEIRGGLGSLALYALPAATLVGALLWRRRNVRIRDQFGG